MDAVSSQVAPRAFESAIIEIKETVREDSDEADNSKSLNISRSQEPS